jgi:arylsulfatase A-like enzyme
MVADDLGFADVGYLGAKTATPNIDRLSRDGVRLSSFRTSPLCSPTRAGLLTGRWPIRYGMGDSVITPWRRWGLPTTEHTLADLLGKAGYGRRGIFGKWHLGHYEKRFLPLNRGFTRFYGFYNGYVDYFNHKREGELDWHSDFAASHESGYATDLIGRAAAAFVADSRPDEPFFLYVPFSAPHLPMQAKPDDLARYAHIAEADRRTYAAMVDSLDQAVGAVLAAIDARGIAEDTFVLFFSDNGGVSRYGSNLPWRGDKGSVYEGGGAGARRRALARGIRRRARGSSTHGLHRRLSHGQTHRRSHRAGSEPARRPRHARRDPRSRPGAVTRLVHLHRPGRSRGNSGPGWSLEARGPRWKRSRRNHRRRRGGPREFAVGRTFQARPGSRREDQSR